MKIGGKQMEMRDHRNLLKIAISQTIDKVLEDNNFDIEYSVINIALCDVMRDNIEYEMEDISKLEDEE